VYETDTHRVAKRRMFNNRLSLSNVTSHNRKPNRGINMNKEREISCYPFRAGRDVSVGIATRYGLDVPGIESRKGRDFPHPQRPALGSSYAMGTGSLSEGGGGEGKAAEAWR
jgi:hypothetical protein